MENKEKEKRLQANQNNSRFWEAFEGSMRDYAYEVNKYCLRFCYLKIFETLMNLVNHMPLV